MFVMYVSLSLKWVVKFKGLSQIVDSEIDVIHKRLVIIGIIIFPNTDNMQCIDFLLQYVCLYLYTSHNNVYAYVNENTFTSQCACLCMYLYIVIRMLVVCTHSHDKMYTCLYSAEIELWSPSDICCQCIKSNTNKRVQFSTMHVCLYTISS